MFLQQQHALIHCSGRSRLALEIEKHLPRDAMKRTQRSQKDATRGGRHLGLRATEQPGARTLINKQTLVKKLSCENTARHEIKPARSPFLFTESKKKKETLSTG